MSEKKGGSGFGLLLLIGVAVWAFLTNPSEQAHHAAITARTTAMQRISLGIIMAAGKMNLAYHNYYVFSYTSIDSERSQGTAIFSVGLFGKVHYGKEKT